MYKYITILFKVVGVIPGGVLVGAISKSVVSGSEEGVISKVTTNDACI
jgi:hypothetical protein